MFAIYCATLFIGRNTQIWEEIAVTTGIAYGLFHLLLVSPLKISLVWWISQKCCPQETDEDFEMFD